MIPNLCRFRSFHLSQSICFVEDKDARLVKEYFDRKKQLRQEQYAKDNSQPPESITTEGIFPFQEIFDNPNIDTASILAKSDGAYFKDQDSKPFHDSLNNVKSFNELPAELYIEFDGKDTPQNTLDSLDSIDSSQLDTKSLKKFSKRESLQQKLSRQSSRVKSLEIQDISSDPLYTDLNKKLKAQGLENFSIPDSKLQQQLLHPEKIHKQRQRNIIERELKNRMFRNQILQQGKKNQKQQQHVSSLLKMTDNTHEEESKQTKFLNLPPKLRNPADNPQDKRSKMNKRSRIVSRQIERVLQDPVHMSTLSDGLFMGDSSFAVDYVIVNKALTVATIVWSCFVPKDPRVVDFQRPVEMDSDQIRHEFQSMIQNSIETDKLSLDIRKRLRYLSPQLRALLGRTMRFKRVPEIKFAQNNSDIIESFQKLMIKADSLHSKSMLNTLQDVEIDFSSIFPGVDSSDIQSQFENEKASIKDLLNKPVIQDFETQINYDDDFYNDDDNDLYSKKTSSLHPVEPKPISESDTILSKQEQIDQINRDEAFHLSKYKAQQSAKQQQLIMDALDFAQQEDDEIDDINLADDDDDTFDDDGADSSFENRFDYFNKSLSETDKEIQFQDSKKVFRRYRDRGRIISHESKDFYPISDDLNSYPQTPQIPSFEQEISDIKPKTVYKRRQTARDIFPNLSEFNEKSLSEVDELAYFFEDQGIKLPTFSEFLKKKNASKLVEENDIFSAPDSDNIVNETTATNQRKNIKEKDDSEITSLARKMLGKDVEDQIEKHNTQFKNEKNGEKTTVKSSDLVFSGKMVGNIPEIRSNSLKQIFQIFEKKVPIGTKIQADLLGQDIKKLDFVKQVEIAYKDDIYESKQFLNEALSPVFESIKKKQSFQDRRAKSSLTKQYEQVEKDWEQIFPQFSKSVNKSAQNSAQEKVVPNLIDNPIPPMNQSDISSEGWENLLDHLPSQSQISDRLRNV